MLKTLFFKFIDILLLCSKKNFYIVQKYNFLNDDNVRISYIYNGTCYMYIGPESQFPPEIHKGFVPCIVHACTENGTDVTSIIKQYAGPKHDFYGVKKPDSSYMIGTKFLPRITFVINYGKLSINIQPILSRNADQTKIIVTDVFNQKRVLEKM